MNVPASKMCAAWLSVCLQTFAITDPVVQRREIDSVCLFFVMVGVVSFFTQMLQVESALIPYTPCQCSRIRESHETPLILSNDHSLRMKNIFLYPVEKLFCKLTFSSDCMG